MKRSLPLQVVVYEDVLCAWSYVARARLETVRAELGDALVWKFRPYALRIADRSPTRKEQRHLLAGLERARREPEGAKLSSELWRVDPPNSSLPALVALEAARLQSPELARALSHSMGRTALELGLNVTRSDIVLELAHRLGLHMGRFTAALQADSLHRLVLKEHKSAAERGVKGTPTLVVGERWMISGLRELAEYRELLRACLRKRTPRPSGESNETLH